MLGSLLRGPQNESMVWSILGRLVDGNYRCLGLADVETFLIDKDSLGSEGMW